jgi:hypothetical protein
MREAPSTAAALVSTMPEPSPSASACHDAVPLENSTCAIEGRTASATVTMGMVTSRATVSDTSTLVTSSGQVSDGPRPTPTVAARRPVMTVAPTTAPSSASVQDAPGRVHPAAPPRSAVCGR